MLVFIKWFIMCFQFQKRDLTEPKALPHSLNTTLCNNKHSIFYPSWKCRFQTLCSTTELTGVLRINQEAKYYIVEFLENTTEWKT